MHYGELRNPFPQYIVPASLLAPVSEVQAFVQAPFEIIFSSALGALSLVCQDRYRVRRPNGLESPCGLFLITVADSGERKSASDRLFAQAIRDFEMADEQAAKEARPQYEADFQAWSVKAKALRSMLAAEATKEFTHD